MKSCFIYIVIFSTFWFCSDQTPTEQDLPNPVNMVQKWPGCDTLEYEPGIDPIPHKEDNRLQIMWYSHPQGNTLSEFRIYRSTEPDGSKRYIQAGSVKVENSNAQDTVYTDINLDLYKRYSYFVTAVNEDGLESTNSDTVWYYLTDEANLLRPKDPENNIKNIPITFEWSYSGSIDPVKYILRIEQYWDINYHPLVFIEMVDPNFGGNEEILIDGEWINTNIQGIPYRWRVDCIGTEELNEGSESDWQIFYLNLD